MRRLLWLLLALVALGVAPTPARAAGFIVIDEAHWWPGPIPPRPLPPHPWPAPQPRPYAPLEVTYHRVIVKIDGQIATTSVDQEFYNPNAQQLEGTFLFPIPKGAQIDKFTMDIGGKQVAAELLPAKEARKIYEDIVRKLKDPALLEYAGRDVFKVRIFPIEARGKKRVTLSYTQVLKADSGLVNYTYPLNTEKFSAKPIPNVSISVELANERPLKAIYSPSHSVEIKRHGARRATVGFEAANTHPDTDFSLYFATDQDEFGVNLLTQRTAGEDGHFLLLIAPGIETKETKVMPKDVAFVLDTSGSMAGPKMEQAKKALQFCVANLNDNDRFEIVRFSTEAEPLFNDLLEASDKNRDRANDFIKGLKPIGGTGIDDALRQALALKPRNAGRERPFVVVFITDGKPTIGVTDEKEIVANVTKNNEDRKRVFCFGVGYDVNTHLLDKISETTRGLTQYVLPEEDIEIKVSSFFAKIKEPVLANPTLKFTGDVRISKMYPAPLPDLFRGDQLVLVGEFSGKGEAAVVLEGTVNGQRKKFTYEVSFPRTGSDHEFIPRLWATRRVGYLLDEIRLRGENTELREEVTELARRYNIVTPYTAYLIVEDEDRRGVPATRQSLRRLSENESVRREAAANWDSFKNERAGAQALAGARYGYELKNAATPTSAADSAGVEANRALGLSASSAKSVGRSLSPAAPARESAVRLAEYSQQSQFIGGKNFFQNDRQWVDAAVQKLPNAKRQRVQFNSADYFALAAKDKRVLPYLALGQNVQFVLDETVYEIYE